MERTNQNVDFRQASNNSLTVVWRQEKEIRKTSWLSGRNLERTVWLTQAKKF